VYVKPYIFGGSLICLFIRNKGTMLLPWLTSFFFKFQALGQDIDAIYVPELGTELTKKDLYKMLVVDPMTGAIEVDWRDFFPYLRWVPNSKWEEKIQRMASNKYAALKALINEQKKCFENGEVIHP
jgi:ent-kaurene oxidase